jgi:tetratricopeptide (TPR) repeat protein
VRYAAGAAAVGVLVLLSVVTWRQIGYWRDSETLFQHTQSIIGPNLGLMMNHAQALADYRRPEAAAEQYRRAIALFPTSHVPLLNLGTLLMRQRQPEEALQCYLKSVELRPDYSGGHFHLGLAYAQLGRFPDAERSLREALRLRDDENTRQVLARVLSMQGKTE